MVPELALSKDLFYHAPEELVIFLPVWTGHCLLLICQPLRTWVTSLPSVIPRLFLIPIKSLDFSKQKDLEKCQKRKQLYTVQRCVCVDFIPTHNADVDLVSMVENLEFNMNRLLISKCHFSKKTSSSKRLGFMGCLERAGPCALTAS